MIFDPITSGALAFLAVLILMALNIPIGISMLIVGFTGFGLIVGFVWCALGILWSSNFIEGLIVAKIKLPLLIVPLSLCFVPRDNSHDKLIASTLIISTFTAAIVGIIWGTNIDFGNFSPFISHIRMGLILALGSGLLLLTNRWKFAALYILVALIEIWHT